MAQPTIKKVKLSDLRQHMENANLHSERGQYMVERSIERFGSADAGTIDKNDVIVSGNLRSEILSEKGTEEVYIIETQGEPVFIKRTDIDASTPEGKELAYALNRTHEVSLAWDAEQLLADVSAGIDLSEWFRDWEIDKIIGSFADEVDYDEAWQGMPEFENEDIKPFHSIKVHFNSLEDLDNFAELIGQLITEKTTYIFHPKQIKEDLTKFAVVDNES